MSFDANSSDAMFARILTRLEQQDSNAERRDREIGQKLDRIEAQALKTNGRVTGLETWQTSIKARVAVIAIGFSAIGTVAVAVLEHMIKK